MGVFSEVKEPYISLQLYLKYKIFDVCSLFYLAFPSINFLSFFFTNSKQDEYFLNCFSIANYTEKQLDFFFGKVCIQNQIQEKWKGFSNSLSTRLESIACKATIIIIPDKPSQLAKEVQGFYFFFFYINISNIKMISSQFLLPRLSQTMAVY